jgi:small-conductance mechanosensitive channel
MAEREPEHLINQSKSVDILRFVLAVLTATFALSGVRQILPTADAISATVGALALGFGADTFKNLITSKK